MRHSGLAATAFFLVLMTSATAVAWQQAPPQPESNQAMATALAEIARRANGSGANPFAPRARADYMKAQQMPTSLRELLPFKVRLAQYLLNDGSTEEAIGHFEDIVRLVQNNPDMLDQATVINVRNLLGIAYLRLGEQKNCIINHSVESCLLPIRGKGIHQIKDPSRKAVQELLAVLEARPDHASSIWLLNLAAMTLGEYPDLVPERWRIDPKKFQSEYDIKKFIDVAPAVGLDTVSLSGGSSMDDYNGDGLMDIVCSSWGLTDQMHYFQNMGDGTFSDQTEAAGLIGITGGLNMVHADYDNDGDPDVYVVRGAWLGKIGKHPNSLLQNDGKGHFTDVTQASGLLTMHPSHTAAWGDYDNDGWLDLFVGYDSTKSDKNISELFRSNGDGTFTEVSKQVGLAVDAFIKGTAWGDYNNDGLLDLYVSGLLEPNKLYKNLGKQADGTWKFEEVSKQAGVTEPLHSFPTWFFDYNNDGWLDIFASGFEIDYIKVTVDDIAREYMNQPTTAEKPRLYRNNQDGTFTDVTKEVGLWRILYTMGSNFGDIDNDGFLDFYVGTGAPDYRVVIPNMMFRNDAGKRFQDVTFSGGFGHIQKGHGVSFGDIDNDGDQDVFSVIGGAYTGDVYQNVLFENPGHDNHWITLKLHGVNSNRAGIGSRIKVTVEDENGTRDIHLSVNTGGSFGASTLQQEIGLGKAKSIKSLQIRWTSGKTQTFENVAMDQFYVAKEDETELKSYQPPKYTLKRPNGDHVHNH